MPENLEHYRKLGLEVAENFIDLNVFVFQDTEVDEGIDEHGNSYCDEYDVEKKIVLLAREFSITEAKILVLRLQDFCETYKDEDFFKQPEEL